MTSLALASAQPAHELDVPARLDALRRQLAVADLRLADAIDARDRAEVLRTFARTARLGLELSNEAAELRLRAERRCGAILLDLVATAPQPARVRRVNGATPSCRMTLPPRTLAELGISPKDSSKWQLLAKLPSGEFDARLIALRSAGRLVSAQPFLRAAAQYARPVSGRPTTPTASLLRRALLLLKEVHVLKTSIEVDLARAVVTISESWACVLEPKPSPTTWSRDITCLMCGRPQPASKPVRCATCGGAWVTTA